MWHALNTIAQIDEASACFRQALEDAEDAGDERLIASYDVALAEIAAARLRVEASGA
jgi:hypothetical protein